FGVWSFSGAWSLGVGVSIALLLAGCAISHPPQPIVRPPASFPADALVTQRAILTARGRQFALNGYVALSQAHGKRLIISDTFGGILADVLVQADGAVRVIRSSRMLRSAWIRRYVAADLECIFGH